FETASGTFQMENGTASTDDVKLSSSAANISLSGSTDLVKKLYDQQMTVMPGVGNTLPVIGAIAAGPGGAAAGLALQGLLHEQLGKATQVQYSITGSWDEPVIEPIIKGSDKPDSEGAGPTNAAESD
ncbi:MAG TPA: AsmA-like C-terminal region-containing protein, partial [Xanthomonadales bacterium]|nr:AsmA-like C-terminal region-containing protein [Xanthomonadales bacterium]